MALGSRERPPGVVGGASAVGDQVETCESAGTRQAEGGAEAREAVVVAEPPPVFRDRRVEVLVRAAVEDLRPLVDAMRAKGWPVEVRADEVDGKVTVSAIITILPASIRDDKEGT